MPRNRSTSLVFFGTGPVAASSLELLAKDFAIEAVVTKPKPSHHRGGFPVLAMCEKLGFKIFTTGNKKELSELFATQPVQSKIGLVIDYGIIITRDVIDYFPLGIVNSHFSLLPRWRGADPITYSILSGDQETGVTLMLINEKLDEGPILSQAPLALRTGITAPELTKELIELSSEALKTVLPLYVKGGLIPVPQDTEVTPTYSKKLTKDDGIIDWSKSADVIEREIRAFVEWPKSRATLAGKIVVMTKARVVNRTGKPGDAAVIGKELIIYCGENALSIERLKPAGKSEMSAEAFLAGYKNLL